MTSGVAQKLNMVWLKIERLKWKFIGQQCKEQQKRGNHLYNAKKLVKSPT